jgi:Holliday junction resolvase RusA-like endonuclease
MGQGGVDKGSILEYSFVVEGRPKPKERPRHKGRRTFTPAATLEAEQRIRDLYEGPLFEGPLGLYADVCKEYTLITLFSVDWTSPLRGDGDNYLKLVQDALQGPAYDNDRSILLSRVRKL